MQHKSSLHSPNDRFVIALHSPDGNLQTGPPGSLPEKRAAELAFWVQQDTFSESGLSAKYAKLLGFPAIFKRAAELAFWVQQDTFSESGLSAKYAKLLGFPAIFRGKPHRFSAVETCWRRELDSNFEYSFKLCAKLPCVSDLPGFHPRNERSGETN